MRAVVELDELIERWLLEGVPACTQETERHDTDERKWRR
jgi:hypothetical protein